MTKATIRQADPVLADLLNQIKTTFGIQAAAVKVGEEIIYRAGKFDQPRDLTVTMPRSQWG